MSFMLRETGTARICWPLNVYSLSTCLTFYRYSVTLHAVINLKTFSQFSNIALCEGKVSSADYFCNVLKQQFCVLKSQTLHFVY